MRFNSPTGAAEELLGDRDVVYYGIVKAEYDDGEVKLRSMDTGHWLDTVDLGELDDTVHDLARTILGWDQSEKAQL